MRIGFAAVVHMKVYQAVSFFVREPNNMACPIQCPRLYAAHERSRDQPLASTKVLSGGMLRNWSIKGSVKLISNISRTPNALIVSISLLFVVKISPHLKPCKRF